MAKKSLSNMTTPQKPYQAPDIEQIAIGHMPLLLSESATVPLDSDGETTEALSRDYDFDEEEDDY